MARSKRRTSSRVQTGQKRKATPTEVEESDFKVTNLSDGLNWYMQQSANSKIYYLKVLFGVVSGLIVGFFYGIEFFANNWFLFPFAGVAIIGIFARRNLEIDKDTINDLKLYAWTGTISLIVAFIVTSSFVFMVFNPWFVSVNFPT